MDERPPSGTDMGTDASVLPPIAEGYGLRPDGHYVVNYTPAEIEAMGAVGEEMRKANEAHTAAFFTAHPDAEGADTWRANMAERREHAPAETFGEGTGAASDPASLPLLAHEGAKPLPITGSAEDTHEAETHDSIAAKITAHTPYVPALNAPTEATRVVPSVILHEGETYVHVSLWRRVWGDVRHFFHLG